MQNQLGSLQEWADRNYNELQQRQRSQQFGNGNVGPQAYGGLYPQQHFGGGCPSCGYCQHCGRGGQHYGGYFGLSQWQA